MNGDKETVVLLLEKGMDPNCKNNVSVFAIKDLENYNTSLLHMHVHVHVISYIPST